MSLESLFHPQSVAVIGASPESSSIGRQVFENLLDARFRGPVYPVHPTAKSVASVRAYSSIHDVPEQVDLAVIAVPARIVQQVTEECADAGVRALVVLSAGFAETGAEGRQLQDRLLETVRGRGMRMVGPNCLGIVNADPAVRLNAIFGRPLAPSGGLAMSSQSGAMGLAIVDYAQELGIGLSQFVSVGNKADVSGNDLLEFWEHDDTTSVIALYLESFGNPRKFSQIARRVGRRKPILAVKSGRGQAGARAARSHTAALAGSDVAAEALFHQAGIIRLSSLEELFDVASLLTNQPLPAGSRVAVITNAGGPGILCADACEANGLEVPELAPATQEVLRAILPPAASVTNPVDMIASAAAEQYELVAQQVLLDPGVDALISINVSLGGSRAEQFAGALRAGVDSAAPLLPVAKPVLACFMGSNTSPVALRAADVPAGGPTIPSFRFPESAARALAHATRYGGWRQGPEGRVEQPEGVSAAAARAALSEAQARGAEWLSPDEVDRLLRASGIAAARQIVVPDPESAATAAAEIGFPVVVKIVSPDVLHKTDIGGVVMGLGDADAVRGACERIAEGARAGGVEQIDGYLVQEQVERAGQEMLVGVVLDPAFGPLVALGLGGVTAEALRDVTFRLAPLTDVDANEMPQSIRGRALLEGYRGGPPTDIAALEDLLVRVSWLVETVHVAEMDLNPVIVHPAGRGLTVLDARISIKE